MSQNFQEINFVARERERECNKKKNIEKNETEEDVAREKCDSSCLKKKTKPN